MNFSWFNTYSELIHRKIVIKCTKLFNLLKILVETTKYLVESIPKIGYNQPKLWVTVYQWIYLAFADFELN